MTAHSPLLSKLPVSHAVCCSTPAAFGAGSILLSARFTSTRLMRSPGGDLARPPFLILHDKIQFSTKRSYALVSHSQSDCRPSPSTGSHTISLTIPSPSQTIEDLRLKWVSGFPKSRNRGRRCFRRIVDLHQHQASVCPPSKHRISPTNSHNPRTIVANTTQVAEVTCSNPRISSPALLSIRPEPKSPFCLSPHQGGSVDLTIFPRLAVS